MAAAPRDKIPVTVLTGFLGSGKTTVLSHLIRQPTLSNAAVIINEFGEISLDHHLVERTDGDVFEIQGGCLCCTVRGDLVAALRKLTERRQSGAIKPFDRVVIETTGLADPAPILHTLTNDPLAFTFYRLDGIVTTVDAVNGAATLATHPEALKQAVVADRLLLTKLDLADGKALRARLGELAPGARIVEARHGAVDPALVFDVGPFDPAAKPAQVTEWLRAEAYDRGHEHHGHHHHDVNLHDGGRHDADIRAFCFTWDKPITRMRLQFFTQLLSMMRGPDLLRVKGIVNVSDRPDQPAVIHGVQHVFHPLAWLSAWPDADRRTRIVFIVRDIAPRQIEELMASLTDESAVPEVADATA
ncbi:MAG: GTP-binding protein [Rhodospirillaceae bacterium]|nr:GTP-binding protein [Rhodospirillaceae bacterium]